MIRIEPVGISFAAELSQLASGIFLETFLPVNKPEPVHEYVRDFLNEEVFVQTLKDPNYATLGVFEGTKLIGYIQMFINRAETYYGTPLELKRFYLLKDHHGKGVAGNMMDAVYKLAPVMGHQKFWLGVWEKNDRAIHFYKKCGFRKIGSHIFNMGGEIQTDDVFLKELR